MLIILQGIEAFLPSQWRSTPAKYPSSSCVPLNHDGDKLQGYFSANLLLLKLPVISAKKKKGKSNFFLLQYVLKESSLSYRFC